jgi:clostripain
MGTQPAGAWRTRPYFDLYDLARRVPLMECATEPVLEAAEQLEYTVEDMVVDSVEDSVVASFGMSSYDKCDFIPGSSGLSIVFPDGSKHWENFTWYTPERIEGSVRTYGKYAWCADGASSEAGGVGNWYQLLASWYTTR